jgi:hypothetical protein
MRRPKLLVPLALFLAAIVLAGCGASPLEILQAAGEKTIAAGSSRMLLRLEVLSERAARPVQMTGEGAFDFASRRGTLDLSVPATAGAPPARTAMIFDKDVVYQKVPRSLASQLSSGKPWLKIDLAALNRAGAGGVASGQSNDPTQALAFLNGITGDVREVGKEKLRDADTTHYSATVDLEKATEGAANSKQMVDNLINQIGSKNLPIDAWIDGDGRLRKERYQMTLGPGVGALATGTGKATTTIELYDFGTAVSITPPPASQVTDATKLLIG